MVERLDHLQTLCYRRVEPYPFEIDNSQFLILIGLLFQLGKIVYNLGKLSCTVLDGIKVIIAILILLLSDDYIRIKCSIQLRHYHRLP